MTVGDEPNSRSDPTRDRRNVESVVLARVIERGADGITEAEVVDGMTSIGDTPARTTAVRQAIDGLVEVELLVRVDGFLRPSPAASRAGELELGL